MKIKNFEKEFLKNFTIQKSNETIHTIAIGWGYTDASTAITEEQMDEIEKLTESLYKDI